MSSMLAKAKRSGRLLLIAGLLVLAFAYAMFQGGFVSWFLFYSFLPPALYALCLFAYPFSCTGERTLSKQEFVYDEPVRIQLSLTRKSRFPLCYVFLEEQSASSLTGQKPRKLLLPGFKRTLRLEYAIDRLPRGEHHFSGVRLKTGDMLGLVEKEKQLAIENKIVVYPAFEELLYRPAAGEADKGGPSSARRLFQNEDTSMSAGVREYQPGDRLAWVNWKATAKRNDVMTKEFEPGGSHDVMIVLDCQPSTAFETAVSFTASLVKSLIRSGTPVGLLTVADTRKSFSVRGGRDQEQQLFYHLATVKAAGRVLFDRVLKEEALTAKQGSTLMLVTPHLTKETAERARTYASRSRSVIVFLIRGKEEPPADARLFQPQAGIRVCVVYEGQFAKAFSEVNSR